MDLNKSIRMTVDSGKVFLGTDKALKAALNGSAKLIIVSRNCPAQKKQDIEYFSRSSKVPVLQYEGTSNELGTVCGKPFPISAISVLEPGNSDILEAVQQQQ
ncbi:MAG: 50S ribosomal protein L30e [Candidatus Micrarchaeia archaeon]|jgi:large subunit ribosomal protein L30e